MRGNGRPVIVYGDYECPYCAALELQLRELPVQVCFRHFPVKSSHPRAYAAACAAEAAALQDAFWPMHDALFGDQGRLEDPHLWKRAERLGRAGPPTLGVEIAVDEHGEVLARSNVVMGGYWQDEAATTAALADGWFHTGDGGAIDGDGYLNISDRKKDVIISGGENVTSIEVEDALMSHPAVREVAVIGIPDEKWGELVTALVVKGEDVSAEELIAHCRTKLAGYKCPKRIEFRDELARTATGKLQKFKLREEFWAGQERQVN